MADFKELKPKVVLGVAAHPDDLEFGAAGTMAVFADQGAEIHYLILTDGGKGSEDKTIAPKQLTKLRRQEQTAALKALGGRQVQFLDYPDGRLEVTQELKRAIVRVIREIKPDVVVTMDPSVLYSAERGIINHPDHRAAGQATLDAIYPLARDHLAFPELFEAGIKPHKTATVLLVNFDNGNYAVDISKTLDKKLTALKAHVSQVKDVARITKMMTAAARSVGQAHGCPYAESFVRIDVRP